MVGLKLRAAQLVLAPKAEMAMRSKGLAVGLLLSSLGACTSAADNNTQNGAAGDSSADSGNVPTPTCADRSETYADDHTFPYDPGGGDPGLNNCAPRCGAMKRLVDEFYSSDALPAGTCTASNVACSMLAHGVCPCPTNRGPVNIYECSCNSGKWECLIVSQGASSCRTAPVDSGSDCQREDSGRQ